MKPQRALASITALIVRCCDPEDVLLFGSYAKGQENGDSDLDILVIANFRESSHLRGLEVRGLLKRYPVRIDLHLVTPEEMVAEVQRPYGFLASARASSVNLFSREKGLLTT